MATTLGVTATIKTATTEETPATTVAAATKATTAFLPIISHFISHPEQKSDPKTLLFVVA